MSKQTRKFKVRFKEEIYHTHVIEIPVSFLVKQSELYVGDDISCIVQDNAWEYMDYPNHVSDTMIDMEYGIDTDVEYLGQVTK
tara:strand:+ start:1137 stop:1385 length:249 start_codon:yes stop_codon:yes gene_type:complete